LDLFFLFWERLGAQGAVERGDNVLAGFSLVIAVLAAFAGIALLFACARLMGCFEPLGAPRDREWLSAMVVFAVSVFCFIQARRFYKFFSSPEIRDRYYARNAAKKD
jgi:hypothetical protein